MCEDFFSSYLLYTSKNECPAIFHRWSAIVGIGAYLGRSCYIPHGHFKIYPNVYALFLASAGSRKSTGINIVRKLLEQASYTNFAPKKTTKEKFLMKLGDISSPPLSDDLESQIFGESIALPAEIFIAAGEFNEFFGNDILSFCSMLGEMWDWEGKFDNEVKNSSSSLIMDPTVSILGGTTPETFATTFPSGIIGQGFFSRILLIHTSSFREKITWPEEPEESHTRELVERFKSMKSAFTGKVPLSKDAKYALDKIYKGWGGIEDVRFDSYSNRRFTHLLKLCLIHAAARVSPSIELEDVVYANTILSYTELTMPQALGEFGKSAHSETLHKIMQIIEATTLPITLQEIFTQVIGDTKDITECGNLVRNLQAANKIQPIHGGFLPKKKVKQDTESEFVDYTLLTSEERNTLL